MPKIGPSASEFQPLESHPAALQDYAATYFKAYGPSPVIRPLYQKNREAYRQFYCGLMRRADAHIGTLMATLEETGLNATTSVIFTSDHGELLGAHGGLHQKWYNAFEETIRVPLVVRPAPALAHPTGQVRQLTDHLDLVPTVLGLLGTDETSVSGPPLTGRDLLQPIPSRPTRFETRDHILRVRMRSAPWVGSIH